MLTGKVVSVKDGDTMIVLVGQKEVLVRLFGIDCPEKGQPFGEEAKKTTSKFCYGTVVNVLEHGRDQYDRVLGEVILEDETSLNLLLLKEGMAWHYKQYSDNEIWAQAEEEARGAGKGLWIDNDAVAPWLFRKEKRNEHQRAIQ
jgi:micrococcal nuclease